MGTKRSVLTDEKGLPLAVVLSGANTHDVKLLEETLDHIVVLRQPFMKNRREPYGSGYIGIDELFFKMLGHGVPPVLIALLQTLL